jgi:predicted esterase
VLAALAYLKTRQEIDPAKTGLIGHSEGGMVAPMSLHGQNRWHLLFSLPVRA